MPDHEPLTLTAAEPDWALRARRLEALCALAAETAGLVEVEPVCARVCDWVGEVLGASAAALRSPLLPGDHHWPSEGAGPGAALDGEAAGWVPLPSGGAALRLPLASGGEALGTLAVAWSAPPGDDAELGEVAGLLAAQTAASLAGV
jgi:hypothetical protein